jgi:integrase
MAHIVTRHKKACGTHQARRCNCNPTYQARVKPTGRSGPTLMKSFPTLAAAKSWATDTEAAKQKGLLSTQNRPLTIREAGERLLADMESGIARSRAGTPYKRRVTQSYAASLSRRIYPAIGPLRLTEVTRAHVQRVVDQMLAESAHPSTIRNTINPLRVIYRRAIRTGDAVVSPCAHLDMPAVRSKRERIAPPEEARALLAALRATDRALWGSAFYAGLRRGEIAGLRWADVDLDGGLIHVQQAYDVINREFTSTKSTAGNRRLPLIQEMRTLLIEHRLATGRSTGLVFGVTDSQAFSPTPVRNRAVRAWKRLGQKPITLHECRHTYASLLIAAGVNLKELSTYMGHAEVATTLDLYGHLFPGHEQQTAARLDAFLGAT